MGDSTNRERDILRAERLLESGAILFRPVSKSSSATTATAAGPSAAVEVFNVSASHQAAGATPVQYAETQSHASTQFVFDSQDSGDLPTILRNEFGSVVVLSNGHVAAYDDTWTAVDPANRISGVLRDPLLSPDTLTSNCRELLCAGTFVAASRFQWTSDSDVLLRMLALSACGFVVAVVLDTSIRRGSFASRESLRAVAWAAVSIAATVVMVASAQHVMLLSAGAKR